MAPLLSALRALRRSADSVAMTSILKAVSLPSNNNGLILLILTMICVIATRFKRFKLFKLFYRSCEGASGPDPIDLRLSWSLLLLRGARPRALGLRTRPAGPASAEQRTLSQEEDPRGATLQKRKTLFNSFQFFSSSFFNSFFFLL